MTWRALYDLFRTATDLLSPYRTEAAPRHEEEDERAVAILLRPLA